MDQPDTSGVFNPIASLDSDVVENAISFLYDRLDRCSGFEATIIHLVLLSHYPRIMRYIEIIPHDLRQKIAIFIPAERMNIYDLALSFTRPLQYVQMNGGNISTINLKSLVKFFDSVAVKAFSFLTSFFANRKKNSRLSEEHQLPSNKKKILFLAHDNESNLYLKPVIPVMRELASRSIEYQVIACDARAESFLKQNSIEFLSIDALLSAQQAASYTDFNQIQKWFQGNASQIIYSENDLYNILLKLSFNVSVAKEAWNQNVQAKILLGFIKQSNISDVFFVPDGTPVAMSLASRLEQLHIPTHNILAAGISSNKRTVSYAPAKNIYCSGSISADALRNHFPDRNIVACGNPGLQRFLNSPSFQSDGRKIILIGTSGYDADEVKWMNTLASRLDSKKYLIILKPHPSYGQRYRAMDPAFSAHMVLPASEAIEPYVNAAEIVITDHSQVGVDAHLLKKHVISMYTGAGDVLYLPRVPSICFAKSVEELLTAIEACINSPCIPATEFTDLYNAGGDSFYYQRVIDYVISDKK